MSLVLVTRKSALLLTISTALLIIALGCGGTAVSPAGSGNPSGGSGGTTTPPPPAARPIDSVQHIIFMLQENRSFDTYFGQLGAYRAQNGYGTADQVNGLPANATNVMADGTPVPAYHLQTACIENMDPDWLESFGDYNYDQPGSSVFKGDGFVHNAQGRARGEGKVSEVVADNGTVTVTVNRSQNFYLFASNNASIDMFSSLPVAVASVAVIGDATPIQPGAVTGGGTITASATSVPVGSQVTLTWSAPGAAKTLVSYIYDSEGRRTMGYYDGNDLPYYYFMASNFATSDAWFSPVPSNSAPNRVFTLAATTHGHAHDPGTLDSSQVKNIFQLLDDNKISWKVYYTTPTTTGADGDAVPGQPHSVIFHFQPFANNHAANIVPVDQYFTDVDNGTLPQVSFIDELPGSDEHPGATLSATIHSGNDNQVGAQYAAKFINKLMQSSSWANSVFILSFDEAGGGYDHVQPMTTVSPDGLPPSDLTPAEQQYIVPQGDFTRTGFRVPLIVVSPFAKKNYVSHTAADHTAILKFIETRFNLPNLTARDKAQMDMTEFFDFTGKPWAVPPTPPAQPTNLSCDYTKLQ
ncbi:MAG: alkaline phosphatase family protein [Terriglobales bacterium]